GAMRPHRLAVVATVAAAVLGTAGRTRAGPPTRSGTGARRATRQRRRWPDDRARTPWRPTPDLVLPATDPLSIRGRPAWEALRNWRHPARGRPPRRGDMTPAHGANKLRLPVEF